MISTSQIDNKLLNISNCYFIIIYNKIPKEISISSKSAIKYNQLTNYLQTTINNILYFHLILYSLKNLLFIINKILNCHMIPI